jgi:hypothetical protein
MSRYISTPPRTPPTKAPQLSQDELYNLGYSDGLVSDLHPIYRSDDTYMLGYQDGEGDAKAKREDDNYGQPYYYDGESSEVATYRRGWIDSHFGFDSDKIDSAWYEHGALDGANARLRKIADGLDDPRKW